MARAESWATPAKAIFTRWWRARRDNGVAGNAKIIAAPAYERLLAFDSCRAPTIDHQSAIADRGAGDVVTAAGLRSIMAFQMCRASS